MNKTKIILAVIGGVVALAVLVMAYFAWSAFSAKTAALEGDEEEGTDGLESVVAKAEQLSRKSVYPCVASVKAVESNEAAVVAWCDEAHRLAARGDRAYRAQTASEFKSFLEQDARRLVALSGGVSGMLMKKDFDFGPFKEYVIDGKMPADDPVRLAQLQRMWDDVAFLCETLSNAGAHEVTGIARKEKTAEQAEEKPAPGKRAKPRKPAKKGAADEAKKGPVANTYLITFLTRPAGFVKAVNALATCERFTVVDDFTFVREKDAIAEALGGGDAQKQQAATTGRRRRRGAAVVQQQTEEKPSEEKSRLVTDPLVDAPIKVDMTVTVYDFRSLEEEGSK